MFPKLNVVELYPLRFLVLSSSLYTHEWSDEQDSKELLFTLHSLPNMACGFRVLDALINPTSMSKKTMTYW